MYMLKACTCIYANPYLTLTNQLSINFQKAYLEVVTLSELVEFFHRSGGSSTDPQRPFPIDGFMALSGIVPAKAGNGSAVALWIALLPAAQKLGQGNKFTGVCLSTGGGGVPGLVQGESEILGGCQKFSGGVWKFQGGVWNFQGVSEMFGGCLQFFSFFFQFLFPPKKILLGCNPPGTVNARPVHILLECILVTVLFTKPLARHSTRWNNLRDLFLLPAPLAAYGSFRKIIKSFNS